MRRRSGTSLRRFGLLVAGLAALPLAARAIPVPSNLAELSIEELSDIEITSLSKHAETLLDAPASVYVISHDDIVRAGVTSIPEALRLAPGVEVARSGAHGWTISIRGFNNDLSNKLLVLIDGRSVYSPLYSGVFWDVQDTLLEDLERIEVVAGPGGTMWGANAVNGVINIITRSAADTRGGFVEVGGGRREHGMANLRYGAALGADTALRGYLQYRDPHLLSGSQNGGADDTWQMARGGFRMDRDQAGEHVTLQGDLYSGRQEGLFRGDFTIGTLPGPSYHSHSREAGANLLGRWTRRQGEGEELQLQLYIDHTERDLPGTFNELRTTVDVDIQQRLPWGRRHDIVWGGGFRQSSDRLDNTLFATFDPARRSNASYNLFLQDKIELSERKLFLTLGSKFEHNAYTGFESQPNARLHWLISDRQTAWTAVSRALRVPSRLDADLHLTAPISIPTIPFPVYVRVNGSTALDPEELIAYEAGYRIQARETLSFDTAIFSNAYKRLETSEPLKPVVVPGKYIDLPNVRANGMVGRSDGATVAVQWQPLSNWRLQLHYAYLHMKLTLAPGSQDKSATSIVGDSPRHQLSVFSYLNLPHDMRLYTGARRVDALPNLHVDKYVAVDAGLCWELSPKTALSLVGQNLNDRGHVEYSGGAQAQIGRSVYAKLDWRF